MDLWYSEEIRRKKIGEFYERNPGALACDECVKEISREQAEIALEITGLRYCGICLTMVLARRHSNEERE